MTSKTAKPEARVLRWQGRFLRVMQCGRWEYADRVGCSGAVAIVAITPEGNLLLTEQYRVPMDQRVLELPAGLAGDDPKHPSEDIAEAARRELLEETGYDAAEMKLLASGPPSAGLATEVVTFYLASGLRRVSEGGGEKGEDIQLHEVPVAQVRSWLEEKLAAGLLVDPKIYAGLYFVTEPF